jgi:hypothetical protein
MPTSLCLPGIRSRLMHPVLSEVAKRYGAQEWLVKQHTSPEDLAQAIQNAVASVQAWQERNA